MTDAKVVALEKVLRYFPLSVYGRSQRGGDANGRGCWDVEFIAGSEGDWHEEGQVLVAINDDSVLVQRQQAMAEHYGRTSSLQDACA